MRLSSAATSLTMCVLLGACGGSNEQPDTGARVDAGFFVPRDGAAPDATGNADATGDTPDATNTPDGGALDGAAPDAVVGLDAVLAPDAETPDAIGGLDADALDADALDADNPDATTLDAGVALDGSGGLDVGSPDTGSLPDTGPLPDAGTFAQGGGVFFSEILARGGGELLELSNTNANAVDLTAYQISVASLAASFPIRAASDPTGTTGTPVTVAADARAWGVPNPASAAAIPVGASFVIGAPGAMGADAFADVGDIVTLLAPGGGGDRVDFRNAATARDQAIGPDQFPLADGVAMSLDPAADAAGGELANDDGDAWCAHIFGPATRGAPNRPCNVFVISELSYDYDSVLTGVDDGQEFVELAGPAGGALVDVSLMRIEGTAATAGNTDGAVNISAARMPLDGLYVIADDAPNGSGVTAVPNADQVVNLVMENGPDALQLIRNTTPPVFLDAFAYGAVTATLDVTRNFPIVEGNPAPDPSPSIYAITFARSDDETDTNDNLADFRYDPSPSPGERNGTANFIVNGPVPANALVGSTATIAFSGVDFTDEMVVGFDQTPAPVVVCPTPTTVNTLICTVTYPAGGSPAAAHVDVTVSARPEHGGVVVRSQAFTWTTANNETDVAAECDYCNLQFPPTLTAAAGQLTDYVYGQIYEAGLTDATSGAAAPGIIAELGYGPLGSDPRVLNWIWVPTTFNVEAGNNDEYRARITAPSSPGSYAYTMRFSLDGGLSWSYVDQNGAGSNGGLAFNTMGLGVLTVN